MGSVGLLMRQVLLTWGSAVRVTPVQKHGGRPLTRGVFLVCPMGPESVGI